LVAFVSEMQPVAQKSDSAVGYHRLVFRPEPGSKTALSRFGNRLSRSSRRSLFMRVVPWRVVATTPDSRSTRK